MAHLKQSAFQSSIAQNFAQLFLNSRWQPC
jgi:hypothetical protein